MAVAGAKSKGKTNRRNSNTKLAQCIIAFILVLGMIVTTILMMLPQN